MEELVSVIIPTYNRKNTIKNAVDSVLNQTYKNIEVIVVDDASTDGTEKIFKDNLDSRVRYYRYDENRGACYARNYGIEHSKGEYIAFQDSDDEWLEEKIEKQLKYLKAKNADFVFCGMNGIHNDEKIYIPVKEFYENKDDLKQILARSYMSTQTMLMKKEVFEKVKFDVSIRRFQDWDLAIQIALNKFKIFYLKEALVNQKLQSNSISKNVKTTRAYLKIINKYKEYYKKDKFLLLKMYMKVVKSYIGK